MQQSSTGGRATPSGQPHTGAFTEGAEVRGSRVGGTAGLFWFASSASPVIRGRCPVIRRAVRGKFKHIGRPTGWENVEGRPWRGWIGLACRCERRQFG